MVTHGDSETPVRALILEDDPTQLETLVELVEDEGLVAVSCSRGRDALARLQQGDISVAVVDLRLPDIGDAELLEELATYADRVSVIINTGFSSYESASAAVNLGAFAYVEKGAKPERLIQHLHRALKQVYQRRNQELQESIAQRAQELQIANKQLREERDKAQMYLEIAGVILVALDAEHRVTLINRKGCEILGQTQDQIVGSKWFDSFVPDWDRQRVKDGFAQLLAGQMELAEYFENPLLTAGGEERCIVWHNRVLRDDDGHVVGTLSSGEDITDRIRADEEIRKFKASADQANYGAGITDLDGNIQYANSCMAVMHGYEPHELVGRHFSILHTKEQQKEVQSQYERVLTEGGAQSLEIWHRRKDGTTFPTLMNAMAVEDDTGQPAFVGATAIDMTESKQAADRLAETQQRLELALRSSNIGLWDWKLVTGEIFFSPEWKRQIGYRDDELAADYEEWESRLHPDDREQALQTLRGYLNGTVQEYTTEFRLRHKDGSYRWILARGDALRDEQGTPTRLLGCHVDITDRKRTEDALKESEANLNQAQEIAHLGSWSLDLETWRIGVSDEMLNIYRYPKEKLNDLTVEEWQKLIYPDDRERVATSLQEAIAGIRPYDIEFRIIRTDGRIRTLHAQGEVIRNTTGTPVQMVGTGLDITERKQSEEALRQSEERMRLAVQNVPVLVDAFDKDRLIIVWNRECERVTGYSADEMIGNPRALELLYPDPTYREYRLASLREKEGDFRDREFTLTAKDGSARTILWSNLAQAHPIPGWAMWGVGVDVTGRRRAEGELRQREVELAHIARVASMGEMVATIAHEVKQPLHAISNYAQGASWRLQEGNVDPDALAEVMEKVSDQAHRASETIRRLRRLLQKHEPSASPVSVNQTVQDAFSLVERESHERGVDVCLELTEGLPPVIADSIQIEQVVLNLVRNAFDAMADTPAEERKLTIATTVGDTASVEVSVQDTGPGFDTDSEKKLFDAFFSSKSHGMGMGLAICRFLIEAHQGKIWAEAGKPCGAVFRFTLPVA